MVTHDAFCASFSDPIVCKVIHIPTNHYSQKQRAADEHKITCNPIILKIWTKKLQKADTSNN